MDDYGDLLADAKGREDLSEDVFGESFAGDLAETLQRAVQLQQNDFFKLALNHQVARFTNVGDGSRQGGVLARIGDHQVVALAALLSTKTSEYAGRQLIEAAAGQR